MRIFSEEVEERAYRHARLAGWRRDGLATPDAASAIALEIGGAPERAAWPLRVVLFGVAAACGCAAYVLMVKDLHDRSTEGLAALLAAVVALGAAEALISGFGFFRHGVEEAAVAGGVLSSALAFAFLIPGQRWSFSDKAFSFALVSASAAAYARYGYRLAWGGIVGGACLFAFSWHLGDHAARVLTASFFGSLLAALSFVPGIPGRERERLEIVRGALALGIALILNLRLGRIVSFGGAPFGGPSGAFEWATFVAVFLIPAAWMAWGASTRSRSMIQAGALGLLVAVCSVKPYLGLKRNAWDPAVLGVELVVLALVLKRWLDAGPGRRRGPFSSESMGSAEPGGALGVLAGFVAAGPHFPTPGPQSPDVPRGQGGDFGGGGASGSF